MFTRSRSATTSVAICYEGAAGWPQRLTGPWQVDTPLVHIQGNRPEAFLQETDQLLDVGRPQELTHFDGSKAVLFALASRGRVRVSKRAGGGSSPREMHGNTLLRACEPC